MEPLRVILLSFVLCTSVSEDRSGMAASKFLAAAGRRKLLPFAAEGP